MKNNIKVALIQEPPVYLNLELSVNKALQLIGEIVTEKPDLIVFPETWLPGYPVWLDYAPEAGIWGHEPSAVIYRLLTQNAIQKGDQFVQRLKDSAAEHEVTIIMGAHELQGRSLYNSLIHITKKGQSHIHRKLMPTYTERLIWAQGDGSTLNVIEENGYRTGGLICWEHWMPLARAAMHSKNEHIHIAQWPMVKELHQLACRNYAFEGQCYVIAAGCVLSKQDMLDGIHTVIANEEDRIAVELIESIPVDNRELLLKGGSSVIKPDSGYLIEPQMNVKETVFAELDLNKTIEGNLYLDTTGHYSRPDIFQLTVDENPKSDHDKESCS
ncbi:carbon-nitrogen hydrolase family protein [Balneola sp. MJW-20]|uniref:carbon-nitrogen hydrolase family protein n=1 Tax=Gracilimonas aurantiaca TaxID=3234185 RepID=UPI003466AF54